MKRFLLWLVGVVLGVGVFLGAVMGVSYAFTTEGSCPDSSAQFGAEALESNGACWQVPLIGGQLDKVFASPATLTVQKLGILYTAHPALTLPDWSVYTTLTIRTASGETVFTGTASEYESFLFPANGEYKAELTVWRVPEGGTVMQFEGGSTGAVRRNLRLEKPAKPTGWYRYAFRFTLQASAEAELSAERVEQGGVVGLRISGMTGDVAPTVETDLGNVQCVRAGRVLATTAGYATCKRLHASSASSTADSFPPTTMPCGPCPASGTTRRGPLPPSASAFRCRRWMATCCECFPACTTTLPSSPNRR